MAIKKATVTATIKSDAERIAEMEAELLALKGGKGGKVTKVCNHTRALGGNTLLHDYWASQRGRDCKGCTESDILISRELILAASFAGLTYDEVMGNLTAAERKLNGNKPATYRAFREQMYPPRKVSR